MSTGALTAMIAGACIGFSGNSHDACQKAAEAGAKQSGFEQIMDGTETYVTKKADAKAHDILGQKGMEIAGGSIFIAKTVVDKSVQFNLPTFGICDRISNHLGVDKYSLEIVWNLP